VIPHLLAERYRRERDEAVARAKKAERDLAEACKRIERMQAVINCADETFDALEAPGDVTNAEKRERVRRAVHAYDAAREALDEGGGE
jgi:hypothetical protein